MFLLFCLAKKHSKPVTFISQNKTVTQTGFLFYLLAFGFGSRPSLTPVILELKNATCQN